MLLTFHAVNRRKLNTLSATHIAKPSICSTRLGMYLGSKGAIVYRRQHVTSTEIPSLYRVTFQRGSQIFRGYVVLIHYYQQL